MSVSVEVESNLLGWSTAALALLQPGASVVSGGASRMTGSAGLAVTGADAVLRAVARSGGQLGESGAASAEVDEWLAAASCGMRRSNTPEGALLSELEYTANFSGEAPSRSRATRI